MEHLVFIPHKTSREQTSLRSSQHPYPPSLAIALVSGRGQFVSPPKPKLCRLSLTAAAFIALYSVITNLPQLYSYQVTLRSSLDFQN